MLREFSKRRVIAFFLLDWLGTLGMLFLAAFLRSELGHLPQPLIVLAEQLNISVGWIPQEAGAESTLFPPVFILVALIWPLFFNLFHVYDGRHNPNLRSELFNVFLGICVSTVILAGVLYLTYRETSRVLFLLFFVLDSTLLLSSRIVMWLFRKTKNGERARKGHRVLVVGVGPVGRDAVAQLKEYAWSDIEIVGYVDDDAEKQGQDFEGLPVLGPLTDVSKIVQNHEINAAVIALPLRAHERLIGICRTLQELGVQVNVIPDLFALTFPGASLDGFGGIPVIHLGKRGIYGWTRFFKRLFDVLAASLGVVVLSPFLLLIAVAIKLDSPGPVFFKQTRIGEHGRPFEFLKFRSMRTDVDSEAHKAYVQDLIQQNTSLEEAQANGQKSLKMVEDPRITRVGRLIRKTSIDELPQLFNVLRGDMSLVGPRPPLPYEVEVYKDWHRQRFDAPPGITGWWQVKGRNRVSFDEMIRMDLYYIEHVSIWLDLKILWLTPRAVITGEGAG